MTINEARLQLATSLVETTGLMEQKPLTVFSTITVVACIHISRLTHKRGVRKFFYPSKQVVFDTQHLFTDFLQVRIPFPRE